MNCQVFDNKYQCTDIQTGPVDGGRSVFQHLLNTNAGVKTAGGGGNVEAP